MTMRFPDGFLWGAATSAYQIEGSPLADGAGPSNWHRFSHTPGRIDDGSNADVACDHYRRYEQDVALMTALGLTAYRFSLSWSRILPGGRGAVNPKGIDFYSRLIDRLLEHGITPFVTLFHWDLPAALEDEGGWLSREIIDWFAEYARVAVRAFGDRVPLWATLNEPWVVCDAGYLFGVHAPGHKSPFEAMRAARHLLCAHGAAVRAFRAESRQKIGIVINIEPKYPASGSAEDLAATERADAYMNRQFLDPLFLGSTPGELPGIFGEAWVDPTQEEMALIREPVDDLGINYYTRGVVRDDPAALPVRARSVKQAQSLHTELGWEVHPESLGRCLRWVAERYGPIPLYVTENGAAFYDPPSPIRGRVEDPLRVDYFRHHLRAAHAAIAAGVDLRGYFAWSLLDNFEWGCGFTKRFGIVHVDYATQGRTIKASGEFYRDVIATRGGVLEEH
jgi:beta-glucosidase